jgi:hypothetical protein
MKEKYKDIRDRRQIPPGMDLPDQYDYEGLTRVSMKRSRQYIF